MIATHHEYRGYVFRIDYRAATQPADPAGVACPPLYAVEFPDFPEIITSGRSLPEAFANACEALDLHLESLHKLGQQPAKPKHKLQMQSN